MNLTEKKAYVYDLNVRMQRLHQEITAMNNQIEKETQNGLTKAPDNRQEPEGKPQDPITESTNTSKVVPFTNTEKE